MRRVTEAVGAVAEAAQQAEVARARRGDLTRPAGGATTMVVAVDGCQAPLTDGWHEVKVGRAAPPGPAPRTDRRSGRTYLAWGTAAICAGLEGAEDCWWRVAVTAWRAGLGQQTRRVVVRGDGAEWIWNRAAHFLGGPGTVVIEILDIFHAYEHLWDAGRAVFVAPDALVAWAAPLEDALYERGAPAVLAALDALAARPLDLTAADVLRRERAYFADNAARMDYPHFVATQLPIGSGAVENLCKTLIEARVKGAGMRWTRAGLQAVVTLRAVRASGDWAAFWAIHPLRERLRPGGIGGRPHAHADAWRPSPPRPTDLPRTSRHHPCPHPYRRSRPCLRRQSSPLPPARRAAPPRPTPGGARRLDAPAVPDPVTIVGRALTRVASANVISWVQSTSCGVHVPSMTSSSWKQVHAGCARHLVDN